MACNMIRRFVAGVVFAVVASAVHAASAQIPAAHERWHSSAAAEIGGVIGERIAITVTNNLMKIDMDGVFAQPFRVKDGSKSFVGTGNMIESLVLLSKYTGSGELLAVKNDLVRSIISAQEKGGYIGCMDGPRRMWQPWDMEDVGFILDGLVLDWQVFGEKDSLDSAVKAAEYVLVNWKNPPKDHDREIYEKELYMGLGHGMWSVYKATGDRRYADFVSEVRGYRDYDMPIVLGRSLGIKGHTAGYLDTCYTQLEMYRRTGDAGLFRQTHRFLRHLLAEDGALVHGVSGVCECWSGDQDGAGYAGETCMSAYALCVLDLAIRTGACDENLAGDLMERILYNAFFGAQSTDGRKLRYYTPLEGVKYVLRQGGK